MGRYKLQEMGRIGSKEVYLIWAKFGITEIYSGLIDITGSTLILFYKERSILATPWQISYFWGRSLGVP